MAKTSDDVSDIKYFTILGGLVLAGLAVVIGGILGCIAGFNAFGRSQAMADAKNKAQIAQVNAHNEVVVTNIQISNQAQQLKVHQLQAQIRLADAVGIRNAEDEISQKLTPLYVQWEYAQTLDDIAKSGKNNSVVYIPTGAGGVPIVAGAGSQPQIGAAH